MMIRGRRTLHILLFLRAALAFGADVFAPQTAQASQASQTDQSTQTPDTYGASLAMDYSQAANSPLRDEQLSKPRPVFIHGRSLGYLKNRLSAAGHAVGGSDQLVWTRASLNALSDLAQAPGVEKIELAPKFAPLGYDVAGDHSIVMIGANTVHQGQNIKHSRTGQGVIIGLVDTGIDPYHPAFARSGGGSRILGIWDQNGQGRPPEGYDYGSTCNQQEIEAHTCTITDTHGHGSHVAGIAAGSLSPYIGVAPDADILMVKSELFEDVVSGVEWMMKMADKYHRPIVVNLSIGGHMGSHDGQSDFERALEQLQGPGKIIVTAAGNDGNNTIHLFDSVADEERRAELSLPAIGTQAQTIVDIWEQSGSKTLSFAIEVRDSAGNLLSTQMLQSNRSVQQGALAKGKDKFGEFKYVKEGMSYGQKIHHMVVLDRAMIQDSRMQEAHWFLTWASTGSFDAWISTSDYRFGNSQFASAAAVRNVSNFVPGDSRSTITIPGTAGQLITVGAYVAKSRWDAADGKQYEIGGLSVMAPAGFTSQGPTMAPYTTGPKPDLSAPGQIIIGPKSSGSQTLAPFLMVGDHFTILQGTSMAAPHVTGVVALMLESKGEMMPAEAKQILTETAATTDNDGPLPNTEIGYGRVQAQSALEHLEQKLPGCNALPGTNQQTLISFALAGLIILTKSRLTKKRPH